jgi:hypothetical protein
MRKEPSPAEIAKREASNRKRYREDCVDSLTHAQLQRIIERRTAIEAAEAAEDRKALRPQRAPSPAERAAREAANRKLQQDEWEDSLSLAQLERLVKRREAVVATVAAAEVEREREREDWELEREREDWEDRLSQEQLEYMIERRQRILKRLKKGD